MKTLDYGVIGNCRSAGLVSKFGRIDWLHQRRGNMQNVAYLQFKMHV